MTGLRVLLGTTLLTLLSTMPSYGQGQWSGNSNTTDPISRTGNVGIGTTSPSAKLHVNTGANAEDGVRAESSVLNTRPGVRIANSAETLSMGMVADGNNDQASLSFGAGSAWGYFYMPKDDASIHLTTTGNVNTVRLGTTSHFMGNVGVGTTAPGTKLDVAGDGRFSGSLITGGHYKRSSSSGGAAISNEILVEARDEDVNGAGGQTHTGIRWGHGAGSYITSLSLFAYNGGPSSYDVLTVNGYRRVGINTSNPQQALDVNGTARAKEVIVTADGWSDFVFEDDYDLPSLEEVERYIEAHGHLPEIPSAGEVQANGVKMGEMQAKLLQKIEELTLYIIQQQEQLAIQQEQITKLSAELQEVSMR